jgi:hypothetical protein
LESQIISYSFVPGFGERRTYRYRLFKREFGDPSTFGEPEAVPATVIPVRQLPDGIFENPQTTVRQLPDGKALKDRESQETCQKPNNDS